MIWLLLFFVLVAMLFLPNRSGRASGDGEISPPLGADSSAFAEDVLSEDGNLDQLDLLTRQGVAEDVERLRAMGVDVGGLGYRETPKG